MGPHRLSGGQLPCGGNRGCGHNRGSDRGCGGHGGGGCGGHSGGCRGRRNRGGRLLQALLRKGGHGGAISDCERGAHRWQVTNGGDARDGSGPFAWRAKLQTRVLRYECSPWASDGDIDCVTREVWIRRNKCDLEVLNT